MTAGARERAGDTPTVTSQPGVATAWGGAGGRGLLRAVLRQGDGREYGIVSLAAEGSEGAATFLTEGGGFPNGRGIRRQGDDRE